MNPDVLIIGGGVIGLTIARELRSRGVQRISIVDRGELGAEASWAAAGMLAPNIEAGVSGDFHHFCTQSLGLYPELAEGLLAETGIDIELDRSGTVCVAFNETEVDDLRRHVTRGAQFVSAEDVRKLEPWVSRYVHSGVVFPNDWQVENRNLISALRTSAELNGVELMEYTEISGLVIDGERVTGATTDDGFISAGCTVLATGAWTSLIKTGDSVMPFVVKPIRGQMAAFEMGERKVSRVVFSRRGYLVPRHDGRVLVGATVEDVGFDKMTTDEGIESLREAAVEIMPALADFPIVERWSGLRPFAADGLPVIGKLPGLESVLVATAHYRNGILLAPRTAQIIADKIVGGADSEFFEVFRADRFRSPVMNASARI